METNNQSTKENFKPLLKIPTLVLKSNDESKWEYHCSGYEDIIEIEYFEEEGVNNKMKLKDKFSVPTSCANQLFSELSKLVDEVENE